MKKFVLALMLCLASTLSFAGTISYYNRTDQTIQMLRDGVPPGIGSNVIPNGFYSETVGYGSYTLSATNGRQTTGGHACTIDEDNNRCDYTVSIRESYNTTPGLTYVALLNYGRFNVNAPAQLTKGETTNGTTDFGKPFTSTMWTAELANGDFYIVGITDYGFATTREDLDKAVNGYTTSLKGVIEKKQYTTVSGQPAVLALVTFSRSGHSFKSVLLIATKGSSAYMFAFATDEAAVGTDNAAVGEFFSSAAIN